MNEIYRYIILILVIIFSIFIRFFIGYKASKVKGIKYLKIKIKNFIIIIICVIIIFTIYKFLPKYETNIDVNIMNNNNKIAEIYINEEFYNIYGNEKIININKGSGFIAIKMENINKIVYYTNDKSIFPFNRSINININNEIIKINSFYIKISPFVENHKNYNSILELLIKKR